VLDGRPAALESKRVEKSRYACLDVAGVGVHEVTVQLA
jgi:hypothetical protein